jgi:hypothetical protein
MSNKTQSWKQVVQFRALKPSLTHPVVLLQLHMLKRYSREGDFSRIRSNSPNNGRCPFNVTNNLFRPAFGSLCFSYSSYVSATPLRVTYRLSE